MKHYLQESDHVRVENDGKVIVNDATGFSYEPDPQDDPLVYFVNADGTPNECFLDENGYYWEDEE